MYINTAIIEKLEYNGTLKSVELKTSQKIGDLVVAFADEYEEPRSGPFHFRNVKYEREYNKKMEEAKSRRLGAGFFRKDGDEYVFRTQWQGIPTKRQELSYYALMLPEYAIPTLISISDPLSNDIQYRRSIKRDDSNNCFIVYIECTSKIGVFNFNLECEFTIDQKRFYNYEYYDEKTEKHYGYFDLPESYNKSIIIKDLSSTNKRIGNYKTTDLMGEELVNSKIEYISSNELNDIKDSVKIVIMTATDIEKEVVFNYLKPLPECQSLKVNTSKQTYTIGTFGEYPIVHVQTNMGSTSPDGAILTTKDVLDYWKPKVLIMPGIAFGKDSNKQKIGDVLISEYIIQYDSSKIIKGHEIPRGAIVRSGLTLFDRFRNCVGWEYKLEDGSKAEKRTGKMLSGSKLVDDKVFKKHLLKLFPEAIGGEMEGSGIYAASFHESFDQWILVKGICDWAENKESEDKDRNQRIAAEAAVSLCLSVMSNPYAFEYLEVKQTKDMTLKKVKKANNKSSHNKNTTIINGPIYGPINTGSGDLYNK
ncbi:hypothetical protein EHE19_017140 [Ruminiclostridium herbifermentans]|uniref:Nucleoside phosphorylase domain-containing protein n=1 Tax=Ruminiclostridium herbifermentans TaxID=2488810 RepID=A0A4U7J657_9FIRM|nr:hypothetical protein [Ruminiclostridium herbifermentans]QNU66555.1 hypothetical protein EHE19_017140 [Ruminiclostridium herbifermentans]